MKVEAIMKTEHINDECVNDIDDACGICNIEI